MRRLVVLFVLSLVGAGAFGLAGASSGLRVDGANVSGSTLRDELAVIAANPSLQCYFTAIDSASFTPGAGGDSFAASGASAWSSLRVEGMAILQYVTAHFHHVATAAQFKIARSSLEAELAQAATSKQYSCPGSPAEALSIMTPEMRRAQIAAQAASLYLVGKINATIPLTADTIKAYYEGHVHDYDTICISVAVVSPGLVTTFVNALHQGTPLVQLVHQYSVDKASAAKGGALGCYTPGQNGYATVRSDVGSALVDHFNPTPQQISLSNAPYALFVAPTKRTTTPFAQAEAIVYTDIQSLNANSAGTVRGNILYRAAVAVDPAFGRWGLGSSGPGVFLSATPKSADVTGATSLAHANTHPYK